MIAVRLNNLGIVYKDWKRFPEALDYFHQALEIEQASGNSEKIAKCLAYIGATHLEMGEYAKCLSYLDQALPIMKKSGMTDDLGRLYNFY
jgi:tetratricopeptide (TPR) repeat protein